MWSRALDEEIIGKNSHGNLAVLVSQQYFLLSFFPQSGLVQESFLAA